MKLKVALADGWSVSIWPHHKGYTAVFNKGGEVERDGRGNTVKLAVANAFRGYKGCRLQVGHLADIAIRAMSAVCFDRRSQ